MTDKMREEFEAWYVNDGYGDRIPTRHLEGYAAPNVNDMWLSWQASRASLCVELPDCEMDCVECHYNAESIEAALDDAGVNYK